MNEQYHLPLLRQLAAFCAQRGVEAWLVGGFARDLLREKPCNDIDLALAGDALDLARAFADSIGAAFFALDAQRGTGRVVVGAAPHHSEESEITNDTSAPLADRLYLDFAQLRAATLIDDLRARDFTVNALAIPLSLFVDHPDQIAGLVVDPCGGADDLAAKRLRPCSDATFRDDPLRLLRAVRQAATLGFSIDAGLERLMRRDARLVTQPAPERVRDELIKLLDAPSSAPWLKLLDDMRILTAIFPEFEAARDCDQPHVHFLPVLAHSLETVAAVDWMLAQLRADGSSEAIMHDALPVAVQAHPELTLELPFADELRAHFAEQVADQPRIALFKLAALLHDNAKPQTKQIKPDGGVSFYDHQTIGAETARLICQRLRFSRGASGYVASVVRAHMRPGQLGTQPVTLRAALRLFRDTGGKGANTGAHGPDVLLHAMADHLGTRGPYTSVEGWHDHIAWTGAMLGVYWGQPDTPPPPLLDGHTLMQELQLSPGPLIGAILTEVHEAQAAGEITDASAALDLARQLYTQKTQA